MNRLRLFWGALLLAGCSGPPAIDLPYIDAEAAARQALAEHDANGDGLLDLAELEKCPSLKSSLEVIDQDGDQKLSQAELVERLRFYMEGNAGLLYVACRVTLDGRPLQGARVSLTPEKFLGPNIKPATGTSDETGVVKLWTEGMDVPGTHYGLFRVEVSLAGPDGQEKLPAKYNRESILGVEVSMESLGRSSGLNIALSSD